MAAKRNDEKNPVANPDPDDLASRNAANPERQDEPDDEDEDPDDGGEGDEECYDSALYDSDGEMTEAGASRVAAASFALPGKKKLPIHTREAVKDSMRKFSAHQFDSPDEKHAAFNRIARKADQFGVGTTKFNRQHAATLDRKDDQDMLDAETKLKAAKADKRKQQRDAEKARADGLATELATAQGKITSLETDLAAAKAESGKRTDAADKEFSGRVNAKAELVAKAISIVGIRKDSKLDAEIKHYAAMSDEDVKKAVIKHVDKVDVSDPRPAYIDALFDGAVARATNDAAATVAGASALAAARAAGVAPILPDPAKPVAHADADDDTEEAAAARMRARTNSRSRQPGRVTKDSVLVDNGSK